MISPDAQPIGGGGSGSGTLWWVGWDITTQSKYVFTASSWLAANNKAAAQGGALLSGPYDTQVAADSAAGIQPPPGGSGGGGSGGGGGGGVSGPRLDVMDTIVAAAQGTIGHCYLYGGAPGPDFTGCWDCSSATNSWVGHWAGQAIPGYGAGQYDGTEHGPSTIGWLSSVGSIVFEIARSDVLGGDIMCWNTHMGVAIDSDNMISALNPSQGTAQTQIDGLIPGETLNCLRLIAVDPDGVGIGLPTGQDSAAIEMYTRDMAATAKQLAGADIYVTRAYRPGWRPWT